MRINFFIKAFTKLNNYTAMLLLFENTLTLSFARAVTIDDDPINSIPICGVIIVKSITP